MRILLAQPGKLQTVPMGGFASKALQRLGHEVIDFDLSSGALDKLKDRLGLSSGEFHGSLNRRFRRMVDITQPEMVLAIFGFDFSDKSLDFLKAKGVARACWWLNDPFQFQRSLKKASGYDYIFTNSQGSVDDYHASGVPHAYWLPTACDPDVHKKTDPVDEYRCDVCFAGDWSPLREEWCTELSKHFDLKVFGPWKKKVNKSSTLWKNIQDGFFTPEKMAQIFSSARVVFNLHSWYGKWNYGTNPRLFEAAGCGACQVVDWKYDIDFLFYGNKGVVSYRDKSDLVYIVNSLLSNPADIPQLGYLAQQCAYEQHTYKNRMHSLVKRVTCGN